jgi:2,4-dienoyl-CoA reductase-like NADH-dependent reductase (Old Yellow Enzyme family)/thioredoxin reductase
MNGLNELIAPIEVGSLPLGNRLMRAPMCTHMSNGDSSVSERLLDFYEEIARGGAGLVMVEFSYIDDQASQCDYNQLGVYDDCLLRGLSELAETIKAQGPAAGLQLCHAGRQRASGKLPLLAPSPLAWPDIGIVPKELTLSEIAGIVSSFGQAAARVKRAGFDLIEIHGAHGYLITEFLSPDTNKRADEYGGDLDNRLRFALEVVKRVREAVGDDFPISFRLSGDEYVAGGITLDEAKITASRLEKAGVDMFHVSAGTRVTNEYQIIPMFLPRGCNLHLAEGVKQVVNVPVAAAGAMGDPYLAQEAISEGKADMVSLARPLLADPHFPRKIKEKRLREIRPCIRCNDCVSQIRVSRRLRCTVNYVAGREERFRLLPVKVPKHVTVIGAGPAGMEAARVAAARGHRVTLYERETDLGGHLRLAGFIDELKELREYYLYQLEKLGVNVILGQEVDSHRLDKENPDAIILAVGGDPLIPDIPGLDSPSVLTVTELFASPVELGDKVLILGGDLIGCEIAWVLADLGKEVSILDSRAEIPFDVEKGTRAIFLREFAKAGVKLLPGLKFIRHNDQGLEVADARGDSRLLPAANLILALGFKPKRKLLDQLDANGLEYRAVGDCRQPARLMGAIHDGALAGWEV